MTTWKIDNAHTQVNFSAKHMMVTTVRGTFHDVQGTIELDETDPSRSRGEFHIAAESVDTNFGARDTHLRSADFFHAEAHPRISFVSTEVKQVGDDQFKVTGDLTIRDVTKPITFDVQVDGIVKGMSGARHAGLSATTKLAARRLGPQLERRPGAGWLAGRQGDQARRDDRRRRGRRGRAGRAGRRRLLGQRPRDNRATDQRTVAPITSASPPREGRPGSGRGVFVPAAVRPGRSGACHHRRRCPHDRSRPADRPVPRPMSS